MPQSKSSLKKVVLFRIENCLKNSNQLYFLPHFITVLYQIRRMMASIQSNQTKSKTADHNDFHPRDECDKWICIAKQDHNERNDQRYGITFLKAILLTYY